MGKVKIRPPFFETSVKCYIWGDAVLDIAKVADTAAAKYAGAQVVVCII